MAAQAHLFPRAEAGEGDGGDGAGFAQGGVKRELRLVGALALPVGWTGDARLVVEDDFTELLAGRAEDAVDTVDTKAEKERANFGVYVLLFAELDFEGRPGEFDFEPGGEQAVQALALNVEVGAVPVGGGISLEVVQAAVDGAGECGGAFF